MRTVLAAFQSNKLAGCVPDIRQLVASVLHRTASTATDQIAPPASQADSRNGFSPKDEIIVAKKQFQQELSELRRKWSKEHRRRQQARERRLAVRAKAVESSKKTSQASKQLRKDERAAEAAREEKMQKLVRDAKVAQGKAWREAIQGVYAHRQALRHDSLLHESRSWILPENLEARINEALDNPLLLYPGEEDEFYVSEDEDEPEEQPSPRWQGRSNRRAGQPAAHRQQ